MMLTWFLIIIADFTNSFYLKICYLSHKSCSEIEFEIEIIIQKFILPVILNFYIIVCLIMLKIHLNPLSLGKVNILIK